MDTRGPRDGGPLASLGAPFASKFLQSSSKTQMDLIDKYGATLCFDFGEALELSWIPDGISVDEEIPVPTFDRDSPRLPNKAWVRAKQNNPMRD
jgi:hypothetical protein